MEEKKAKTKNGKTKKFLTYAGVVALILAAVIISLLFYRQKIETVKEVNVFKSLTEDWQTYKSDRFGFSFKYPKEWKLNDFSAPNTPKEDGSVMYVINDKDSVEKNIIKIRVIAQRSVETGNPADAIQISIPFDKQNYLIFSTSTNSNYKEIFYNIPVTLEFKK